MGDITLHLGPSEPTRIYLCWFDDHGNDVWTSINIDVKDNKVLEVRQLGQRPVLVHPRQAFRGDGLADRVDALKEKQARQAHQIDELEKRAIEIRKGLLNADLESALVKIERLGEMITQLNREREALSRENASQRGFIDLLLEQATILRKSNSENTGRYFCAAALPN